MSAIIPIFIPHVGCPHDCVFCNQKRIASTISAPRADEVADIIRAALENTGRETPAVAFYGGSFTALSDSIMRGYLGAAESFVRSGKVSGIRLSTRPDCIDDNILSLLSEYGVKTIELGVQSMSDAVLEKSGRGHTAEDAVRAAELVKEYGFELILQMMAGLPGSSDENDKETARRICALKPHGVRIYPVVVIRDTVLERMWRDGEYEPMSVEEAASLGGELLGIFAEAKIRVIRFGLNPTDDLSGGDALAGAYHPALGELAQSERYLKLAKKALGTGKCDGDTQIFVSPSRVSAMVGHGRKNRALLEKEYGMTSLKILGDAKLCDGEVRVVVDGQIRT